MKICNPATTTGRIEVEILNTNTNFRSLADKIISSCEYIGTSRDREILVGRLSRSFQQRAEDSHVNERSIKNLIGASEEFLSTRYSSLGLSLPPAMVFEGTISAAGTRNSRGVASIASRSFGLGFGSEVLDMEALAFAVHEMTHAAGYVRYQPTQALKVGSVANGWKMFRLNPRVFPEPETVKMFDVLEEAVAFNNEVLCWQQNGGLTETEHCRADFGKHTTNRMQRMAAVLAEVAQPVQYAKQLEEVEQESTRGRQFLETLANDGFQFEYALEKKYITNGEVRTVCHSKYDSLPVPFRLLAEELYPNSGNAYEQFMDDLTRAQVTGDKKPVLRRIKANFGSDAVRFFALLQANDRLTDGGRNFGFDTALLTAYAMAGRLSLDRALILRRELTGILFEDRGKTLTWAPSKEK